jgi:hypothetical protein
MCGVVAYFDVDGFARTRFSQIELLHHTFLFKLNFSWVQRNEEEYHEKTKVPERGISGGTTVDWNRLCR